MQNLASAGVVMYWQELCRATNSLVGKKAKTTEELTHALIKLQESSTTVFAQALMGLPKGSDLKDVLKDQTVEEAQQKLPEYAEKFAEWALKK
jgi:hypothetical protein